MNTIERVKQYGLDSDLKNGRVVVGVRGLKTRKSHAMSKQKSGFWRINNEPRNN